MMKTIAFQQLGDCLLAASGDGAIDHDEFTDWLQAIDRPSVTRYLCSTLGATTVTSKQRQQAADILRRRNIQCAILTDSKLTAGVITAVRWLGIVHIHTFLTSEKESAIEHLGLGSQRTQTLAVLAKCEAEIEPARRYATP